MLSIQKLTTIRGLKTHVDQGHGLVLPTIKELRDFFSADGRYKRAVIGSTVRFREGRCDEIDCLAVTNWIGYDVLQTPLDH
jgi:hypothetical protein